MLRPVDGVDVDPFLYHLPERTNENGREQPAENK